MNRKTDRIRVHARRLVGPAAILCAAGAALYSPFHPLGLLPTDGATLNGFQFALRAVLGGAAGGLGAWFSLPDATPRQLRYGCGTAVFMAATCVAGMELQNFGTLRAGAAAILLNIACWLGLSCLIAVCLIFLMQRVGRWLRALDGCKPARALDRAFSPSAAGAEKQWFWAGWALIFLCWVPVWLAFFPALGNYDLASHVAQCVTNQYSTMHPLAYTLLLKAFILLSGDRHELAVAGLAVFQMLCLSGCFAASVATLRRYLARAWLCVPAIVFYAVFPVFPLMAISTTKDVLFSALALCAMLELIRMLYDPEAYLGSLRRVLVFLLTGLGMGLLRYNGIISLILYLIGLMILWKRTGKTGARRIRLKAALLILCVLALTAGCTRLLNIVTHAAPSYVTQRDVASLPSQQMIRAALATDDYSEYLSIMFWYGGETALTRYRPRLADYTKAYIDVSHDNGWRGYYETWLKVGLRHPKEYLEAFLELNRGLWFADDTSHADIYGGEMENFGYLTNNQVTCVDQGYPIRYESKLPGLQAWLNYVTTDNAYLSWPALRLFFSIGAQCWLALLIWLAAGYRRDRVTRGAALWPLCLILVLMAAPAVLVRYALPIFCCNPILLLCLTRRQGGAECGMSPSTRPGNAETPNTDGPDAAMPPACGETRPAPNAAGKRVHLK